MRAAKRRRSSRNASDSGNYRKETRLLGGAPAACGSDTDDYCGFQTTDKKTGKHTKVEFEGDKSIHDLLDSALNSTNPNQCQWKRRAENAFERFYMQCGSDKGKEVTNGEHTVKLLKPQINLVNLGWTLAAAGVVSWDDLKRACSKFCPKGFPLIKFFV